jgi:hypothetical protein
VTVKIAHRQHFEVAAETYWRELCLSLAYQERLYCEALGFQSMQVLEHSGGYEQGMKRRLRLLKPLDAPAAVTKLFGSVVTLEEHSEFDPAAQRWSFRMVPSIMAERIDMRGSVQLAPQGSGSVQISENALTCRLFGLGGIIEPFMARSAEQGHLDKTTFTERYIAEKQLR